LTRLLRKNLRATASKYSRGEVYPPVRLGADSKEGNDVE
jgi:hypothetical protein